MAAPSTFLALAGASLEPPALRAATVLVVDAQREYVDGIMPLPDVAPTMAEIGRLIGSAREVGAPVVHVRHRGKPGGIFDPATFRYEIDARAAPEPGEPVVDKGLPNAFAGTDLVTWLRAAGRNDLVVCGFQTHGCISATARAALDHGFRVTVIAAACCARDLPDGQGGVIPAETVHRIELVNLSDRVAIIVPTLDRLLAAGAD